MRYPDEIIEEVRQKNNIVDIVGSYVKLKKTGSNYMGLCPFHNEKSGSFSVSESRQMYHCFGCGVSGNVFTFLMEYENYTFVEALKVLAEKAGVTLPEREETAESRRRADERNAILEINKEAATYYYYNLRSEGAKVAQNYLLGRKLTPETIKSFGLGFSGKGGGELYNYLKGKGYKDEILKESGLFTFDEARGVYDKFWNRVMFPIFDVNNRVIGFGGRVMGDGKPKYLNSPETKVFDKSRNLYGLNKARQSREKYMLCCEGYMDVISMHQAGFTNAVASLGTALTGLQASLLKRYTDTVILTYDSDEAGVKAALRAIPIFREAGITTKVLNLKPHKDPDEFLKNEGVDAFRKRIEEAENSFYFEIRVL
ncbi:MAG: DNA primase, partial [Lachnospiraceae bacterium]|nr:DNA primase [Lachnospiraceae bacterium]